MKRGNSLTISACSGRTGALGRALLAASLLAGCTIETGPPPESNPPLVPESAKAPPPPSQLSEPQAWSRDLDLHSAPAAADRGQMSEGLVAGDAEAAYSGERLTFESAFNPEKAPSEADLVRQRARQRAAAAGLPPPPVVAAAPVTAVEAQSLPAEGEAAAAAPRRESRLPPPPKFPPMASEPAAAVPAPAQETAPEETHNEATGARETPAEDAWAKRQSRLPPPPKFPPAATAEPAPATAPEAAPEASAASAPAEPDVVAAAVADFAAEAWDAPAGTILVQVSAVPDGAKVTQEWQRLQDRYPQVLKPLRLVVEEAKLGERGVFYRVQAGAFGTQEGAAAACDSLISQGQACFVVVR